MFEPVRYHIDLTHRRQHLVTVTVVVPKDCAQGATVALPCWTPGSYLRRDYIRHLQHITACDTYGNPVTLTPLGGDSWQLPNDTDTAVTVTLELFANDASVRTNTVDASYALLIPAATCLQVMDATDREHQVTIPATNATHSVFSLLPAHPSLADTFVATDYHHLIDGAFAVGEHAVVTETIDDIAHTFVWAGPADQLDTTTVIDTLTQVARACTDVFATPLPTNTYTLLTLTGASGSGGLEHRDGAVLHVPDTIFSSADGIARFQSLVAHEYLHAWNVKRLIPHELIQLRYDQVVRTRSLWLAEGFTAYYDGVLCVRTGLWHPDRLLDRFGRTYTSLANTPGVTRQSLQDASWHAPERQYRRDENAPNAMTEYYSHGGLVALELDALLRGESPNGDGLDALMRMLWQRHHDTGYTDDDVFTAIADIADDTVARRIKSRVSEPGLANHSEFADALSNLGLALASTDDDTAWLGVQLAGPDPAAGVRLAATLRDGPAWQAGLTGHDTLIAIDNTVLTVNTFTDVLRRYTPGDTVAVKVLRHNRIDTVHLTAGTAPATFTVTIDDNATDLALTTFRRWLGRDENPSND